MKVHTYLEWMPEFVIGAEGEEDAAAGNAADDSASGQADDDASGGDENDQDDSDDAAGSGDDDSSADDRRELKEALAKERKANRQREKELNRLRRERQEAEEAEQGELAAAQAKLERLTQREAQLASGYLKSALDREIERAAVKAGFIDVSDALAGVDRSKLSYEQDEDDPSEIEIDGKSIAREVKSLAGKKPHFIRQGTDDGEPSGSTFGGAGRRKNNKADDEALRQKYPSLNY